MRSGRDDERAAAELKLTHSVLTYARHLSQGRVSYSRVSGSILYPAHGPDTGEILSGGNFLRNLNACWWLYL